VGYVKRFLGPAATLLALVVAWSAAALPLDGVVLLDGAVPLPGVVAEVSDGAVVLRLGAQSIVYVDGLGWLADFEAPPPIVDGDRVYAAPAVAHALGLLPDGPPPAAPAPAAPAPVAPAPTSLAPADARLVAVRVAGDVDLRVVLDVDGLEAEALRALGAVGRVESGGSLRLDLPPLLAASALPARAGAFDLQWQFGPHGTRLELHGVAFGYEVFALGHPTRLVIDLWPDRDGIPAAVETVEALAPGVVYRSFRTAGSGGAPTRVHVVEVAPGAGEWRVVGAAGETRPTLAWADGAFAAINGGYFDPGSRTAIGLLVVDGNWLSLPSRGRAAVGFGPEGVIIDRVRTRTGVWIDDRLVLASAHALADRIEVHPVSNGWAGSPRMGALLLDADGVVVANRVGPVRVPSGGSVVVYPPELRALALADEGARVRTAVVVEPVSFAGVRYAVEAGPLLLKDGADAFDPTLEAFARGVRILDDVTQQAAIAVMADGAVLLVAVEAMVAADLVPLLLRLGAVDAMRLDSGGSTTLVAAGRVLNRRTERAVVNAIVWRPGALP
jgi:hypothetical protein